MGDNFIFSLQFFVKGQILLEHATYDALSSGPHIMPSNIWGRLPGEGPVDRDRFQRVVETGFDQPEDDDGDPIPFAADRRAPTPRSFLVHLISQHRTYMKDIYSISSYVRVSQVYPSIQTIPWNFPYSILSQFQFFVKLSLEVQFADDGGGEGAHHEECLG